MPADELAWSEGAALVATGIPVSPIHYQGTDYAIGQANNFIAFPGIGLGVVVAGAQHVTKAMLSAAAQAVAGQADASSAHGCRRRCQYGWRTSSLHHLSALWRPRRRSALLGHLNP